MKRYVVYDMNGMIVYYERAGSSYTDSESIGFLKMLYGNNYNVKVEYMSYED